MASGGLTPYQGPDKMRGFFHCDFGHYWESANTWANSGMYCRKCLDAKKSDKSGAKREIGYTYPHTQEKDENQHWSLFELVCKDCDNSVNCRWNKSKPCPCGGRLKPVFFVICECGVEHVFFLDVKEAKKFRFVCREMTGTGEGCDRTHCALKMRKVKRKSEGPHPNELCEKCDEIKGKCYKHSSLPPKKPGKRAAKNQAVSVDQLTNSFAAMGTRSD